MKVYVDYLEVGDGSGGTRRVLLEGDPIEISYNDLVDRPGNLPPITMTANPQLASGYNFFNGVYLYESSIAQTPVCSTS